jgi:RimJ/RimL family protein N-acetyltransferase
VLSPDEVRAYRAAGIPLGYDCAQIGWVPLGVADIDDLGAAPRASTEASRSIGPDTGSPDTGTAATETAAHFDFAAERRSFEAEIARVTSADGGPVPADAMAGLEELALSRVRTLLETGDVRAADRYHWLLQTALADVRRSAGVASDAVETDTASYTFRPWSVDDVEVYLDLLRNPRLWKYIPEPYPEPFTEETARTLIEVGSYAFHHVPMAVEFEGEPIGQCLLRFDRKVGGARSAEVAYWLGEAHWGKGHMSRILPAFTAHAFANHDVDVIYAWIHRDHAASRRVAERSGYLRDSFPGEARLAELLDRAEFIRFAVFPST